METVLVQQDTVFLDRNTLAQDCRSLTMAPGVLCSCATYILCFEWQHIMSLYRKHSVTASQMIHWCLSQARALCYPCHICKTGEEQAPNEYLRYHRCPRRVFCCFWNQCGKSASSHNLEFVDCLFTRPRPWAIDFMITDRDRERARKKDSCIYI